MRSTDAAQHQDRIERVIDIALCVPILIFVAPLMIVIAVLIHLQDGGPVMFGHTRIGRDGRLFKCLKFRSMVVDSEARLQALLACDPIARAEWERDFKLGDDPRVTPLGNFLRRSSLDELPQIINVLRGEMSLVGPRPIVPSEVARYGRYFSDYCAQRPGITGLWQISGRNDVSYRRRIALDVRYARTRCLTLYLKILLATAPAVLTRKGAR
jgi:lipopolysaccharide/colanic/teichoic acid biosynthesis glycosyltransferase